MTRYLREHEKAVREALDRVDRKADLAELFERNERMIARMQHERLVHLLVTLFTGLAFLFSTAAMFLAPEGLTAAFFVATAVLFLAYVIHYFRLENGVQRLYRLGDRIREGDSKGG
jgi:hypothetical protein